MGVSALSNEEMYNIAHVHVRYWERDFGGMTNNPKDPGGPTRNGVSLAYLKDLDIDVADLNKDGKVDIEDIKLVDFDTAKRLFRRTFWEQGKAELAPPLTSIVYYDFSVTSGSGRATIELQKAIDELCPGTIVDYSANFGPKTQRACKSIVDMGKDFELANKFQTKRQEFYTSLATGKPSIYGTFIAGWTARVNACRALVNEIHTSGITAATEANIRRGYGF